MADLVVNWVGEPYTSGGTRPVTYILFSSVMLPLHMTIPIHDDDDNPRTWLHEKQSCYCRFGSFVGTCLLVLLVSPYKYEKVNGRAHNLPTARSGRSRRLHTG